MYACVHMVGGGGGGGREGVVNMYRRACIYIVKDLCRRVWERCSIHMGI